MRLYHGTSSRHLDTILEHGLVPRGDTPSNWPAASSAERVYLTNAYAMYFAQSSRKDRSEDLLVVEIDTDLLSDLSRLQADEDSAWFVWHKGSMPARFCPPFTMTDNYEQAMHFSGILDELSEYGIGHEMSLELIGNCSHLGTIPPSAITKMVRYSASDGPWWIAFHDPIVSPLNFRFNGSEYRATQLVVADRLDEARMVEQLMPGFLDLNAVEEMCAARRTHIPLPSLSTKVVVPTP